MKCSLWIVSCPVCSCNFYCSMIVVFCQILFHYYYAGQRPEITPTTRKFSRSLHFCQTLEACQEMQRTDLTVFCLSMYNSRKYCVKPLCDREEINRKGIYFFTLNHKATWCYLTEYLIRHLQNSIAANRQ